MSIFIPVGFTPPPPASSSSSFHHRRRQSAEFSEELRSKLNKLAGRMDQRALKRVEEPWEEDEEADLARTPERMCEWMRMARNNGTTNDMNRLLPWSPEDGKEEWLKRGSEDDYCCHSQSSGFCSSESVLATAIQPLQSHHPSAAHHQQLVISYREFPGGPPFVVKIEPRHAITFRQFRHFFGIPLDQNKRFLFKEECEDGSAPFQWRVIDEDAAPVPFYQGRIFAECRTLSGSD